TMEWPNFLRCELRWRTIETKQSSACNKPSSRIKCPAMVWLNRDGLTGKVLAGERISADEALQLYRWPLEELGALAHARRDLAKAQHYGGRGREIVTYIVD